MASKILRAGGTTPESCSLVTPTTKIFFEGSTNAATGRAAEDAACGWLGEHVAGVKILKRNYRTRFGEIDVIFEVPKEMPKIAREKLPALEVELVFLEVRARGGEGWGHLARESIGPQKRLRIARVADYYLAGLTTVQRRRYRAIRFDALVFEEGRWCHLPNAW